MSFNLSMLIGAILKVASGFVPSTYRWALSIVADLLQSHQARMGATADEPTTAATSDDLKTIIAGLFDAILSQVSGKWFLSQVVTAIRDFVLNNLIDAIWSTLQAMQSGAKASAVAHSTPAAYHPAEATKLGTCLAAAVDKSCCCE